MNKKNVDVSPARLLRAMFASGVLMTSAYDVASAAPSGHFVGAQTSIETANGNSIDPEKWEASQSGPFRLETGSLPVAYGDYRSDFGSHRLAAYVDGGQDREVFGASIWSDAFTVHDAPSGVLTLRTRITGFISGLTEVGYALWTSPQPFDFEELHKQADESSGSFWSFAPENSTRLMITGFVNGCAGSGGWSEGCQDDDAPYKNYQGSVDITLNAELSFIQDQPIYVLSALLADVGDAGGTAVFLNSAHFGISAPIGASITTGSGLPYASAAAVPEPSTWLLIGAGVVLAALRLRRSRG